MDNCFKVTVLYYGISVPDINDVELPFEAIGSEVDRFVRKIEVSYTQSWAVDNVELFSRQPEGVIAVSDSSPSGAPKIFSGTPQCIGEHSNSNARQCNKNLLVFPYRIHRAGKIEADADAISDDQEWIFVKCIVGFAIFSLAKTIIVWLEGRYDPNQNYERDRK